MFLLQRVQRNYGAHINFCDVAPGVSFLGVRWLGRKATILGSLQPLCHTPSWYGDYFSRRKIPVEVL
jgi:hypothetical protein